MRGTSAAIASTKSHARRSPASVTVWSMVSEAMTEIRSCHSSMERGTKRRLTVSRCAVCSGGSIVISICRWAASDRSLESLMLIPPRHDENRGWSPSTSLTSAWLVTDQ